MHHEKWRRDRKGFSAGTNWVGRYRSAFRRRPSPHFVELCHFIFTFHVECLVTLRPHHHHTVYVCDVCASPLSPFCFPSYCIYIVRLESSSYNTTSNNNDTVSNPGMVVIIGRIAMSRLCRRAILRSCAKSRPTPSTLVPPSTQHESFTIQSKKESESKSTATTTTTARRRPELDGTVQ